MFGQLDQLQYNIFSFSRSHQVCEYVGGVFGEVGWIDILLWIDKLISEKKGENMMCLCDSNARGKILA